MNRFFVVIASAIGLAGAVVGPALAADGGSAPQVNYRVLERDVALNIAQDGSYTKTVSRVVQPLTVSGVQNVSQVQIDYPANFASVKILAAYTETTSGQKVKVSPSAIFSQSASDAVDAPFLSDGRVKNVVFPAVSPGAVIHLKYVEHFKNAYLPGIYAVSSLLVPSVPVKSAKISVTAPTSMSLHYHARGDWTQRTSHGQNTTTITATARQSNVDFPPGDTVAPSQYAPMAVIGTAANWQQIAAAYTKLSTPSLKVTPAIARTARQAADGATGEKAVSNIYRWVQKNIQAVDIDDQDAGFAPPTAARTLARGMGDTNASAVLLCSLLKAVGITAEPAMISTTQRFVPYPGATPFAFGQFLVHVPKYSLYLDTSHRYAGVQTLPLSDAGRPVLLTGKHGRMAQTPPPTPRSARYREIQDMTLTPDGVIRSQSHVLATGWQAIALRENLLADQTGARLQNFVRSGYYAAGHTGTMTISDIRHRDDLNSPVSLLLKWRNTDAVIPGQRMALVVPTPGRISDELASFVDQDKQSYPSVLDPGTIQNVVHLHLPAGMQPVNLPDNEKFVAPFGSFQVQYHYANGVLDETRTLRLKRFVVGPAQYPQLHRMAVMATNTDRKGLLFQKTSGAS